MPSRCLQDTCTTQPHFNYQCQTKPLYCAKHKIDGMINIVHKLCLHDGCATQPKYNYQGQTKRLYCAKHKIDGMINVSHNPCFYEGCTTQPTFNYEGRTKRLYCVKHKLDGMINVGQQPCFYEGCSTRPIFNYDGQPKALYCSKHRLDGMIDVCHKTCVSEFCDIQIQPHKTHCFRCSVHLFPDEPNAKHYKTKERLVVDFVKNKFPDITWTCDKTIADGCSRRRPDLFADFGEHVLVVEIDEDQHTDYSCENKRLMQLFQDAGSRKLSIIRFNPDSYIDSDGSKLSSCFAPTKDGLLRVKPSKLSEWSSRLSSLGDAISSCVSSPGPKEVNVVKLFYSF